MALDLFWTTNEEWFIHVGCFISLRDDAPPEAKASYENFMKQIKASGNKKSDGE